MLTPNAPLPADACRLLRARVSSVAPVTVAGAAPVNEMAAVDSERAKSAEPLITLKMFRLESEPLSEKPPFVAAIARDDAGGGERFAPGSTVAPKVVPPSSETSLVQSIGDAATWFTSVPPAVLMPMDMPLTVADTAVPRVRLPGQIVTSDCDPVTRIGATRRSGGLKDGQAEIAGRDADAEPAGAGGCLQVAQGERQEGGTCHARRSRSR